MFNEHSETAKDIMRFFEMCLIVATGNWDISYKTPAHDMARKILNEILEFQPASE